MEKCFGYLQDQSNSIQPVLLSVGLLKKIVYSKAEYFAILFFQVGESHFTLVLTVNTQYSFA